MTMHEINDELTERGFWQFNIGHVIVIVGMLGAFLVWWSSFGSLPRETAQQVAQLTAVVKEINDKGTVGSRLSIAQSQGQIAALDNRIATLERNYFSLNEKLTDVQGKLTVIAALLEADKKPKK